MPCSVSVDLNQMGNNMEMQSELYWYCALCDHNVQCNAGEIYRNMPLG